MISSILQYRKYYQDVTAEYAIPGEHHFVCTYLVPKLFSKTNIIPFYINPDGMKDIVGDIAYGNYDRIYFSIEVKLDKVNFTKSQYDKWISIKNSNSPTFLIALTKKAIFIIEWKRFISIYNKIIGIKEIRRYSPIISEEIMIKEFTENNEYYLLSQENVDVAIDNKINEISQIIIKGNKQ